MSGRFFTAQVGSIYLTHDGTSGGRPCKVQCRGIEAANSNYTGAVTYAADGKAYLFLADVGDEGKAFEVAIAHCPVALFDALVTALNDALEDETTVRVIAEGDSGAFDVQALPNMPSWLSVGEFSGAIIKDVALRFVSAGPGA